MLNLCPACGTDASWRSARGFCGLCGAEWPLVQLQSHARATDPSTSVDAARLLGTHAESMATKLLQVYRSVQDATADEAASQAGYTRAQGAWKRVSDLLNAGLIEDTGQTRQGQQGRAQRVLRVCKAPPREPPA